MDPPPSRPSSVHIAVEPFDSDGPTWVVAQAEAELVLRYGYVDESEHNLTSAQFDPPAGAFLVARSLSGDLPLGGVGLRPMTGGIGETGGIGGTGETGEIKRLFVSERWRGLGIARSLMQKVEHVARTTGFTTLRLGTGSGQPEAIALYSAMAWDRLDQHWDGGAIRCGSILFSKDLT